MFSGVLQFIPVLGPSLLIAAVAAVELAAGQVNAAIVVTGVGLFFVGFLPDAIIRPQLASVTTGMPASLYFVGFTGGTLSLGVVGVIAGPLAVAMVVETVELVTEERDGVQRTLPETVVDVEHAGGPGREGTVAGGENPATPPDDEG